jgi:glycyl-tRNA synthetase beta chain
VIAARLSNARFFWTEDLKRGGFDAWNEKLDGVVFQAKLGDKAKTIGAKVRRLVDIVRKLGGDAAAQRAAAICKADLASHVVSEFPEVQGVMGKHFAVRFGEPREVADVIEQHWWPKGQGAALPVSPAAQLVALADRIDTLFGCFATGLVPTGNADQLGLRRAAIGVLQIQLASARPEWSVRRLLGAAELAYGDAVPIKPAVFEQLEDFFRQRLRGILVDDHQIDAAVADVTLGAGFDVPADALQRARALQTLPADTKAVFKRIGNILDDAKAKGFGHMAIPEPTRFTADVERALHRAHALQADHITASIAERRYRDAFAALASLGQPLAAFFDKGGVMVMDPDPALRENRLALLRAIYEPFAQIGDFRKLGASA